MALGEYLSLDEAVVAYRVSKVTLHRLIRKGKLTKFKREGDRRTLVRRSQLDRLFRPRPAPGGQPTAT